MTTLQKIIVATLLFGAWGATVALNMSPVEPFVAAIRDALIAIGVFTATRANPKE